VDSFLFPFDNHDQIAKNGDMAVYIPLQEKVLQRYMKQEGVSGLPADLAGYEAFVRQTVADNQKKGGVAMKFEAAYFRSLYFGDPPREKADAIYAKHRAGGVPSAEDYTVFQDYIFRVLIDEAGKLGLSVHFHSAVGIGDYFSQRNGHPLNLENVVRDPRYSKVNFVLIHGGYPYTLDMIWMTQSKNVYTDSSLMGYYVYPSELKRILKQWISLYPEKIMFGSDAFPFNEAVGAEETFWLAARSARTAVTAALAELVSEGAFNEEKALELAHMYLHDNAAKLYGGKP
jgi:predicted TIM-barrel fold metal-dependent hydrolase